MKIKINEPGFTLFTGEMYAVKFVDGVSVEPVNRFDAMRIGAAMRISEVTETGEGGQVSPSQVLLESKDVSMPVVAPTASAEAEGQAEGAGSSDSVPQPDEPKRVFTREELSNIADAEGISGLRRAAEAWGVRGRSIGEIIEGVLRAQAAGE